jgi:hypothetical protein
MGYRRQGQFRRLKIKRKKPGREAGFFFVRANSLADRSILWRARNMTNTAKYGAKCDRAVALFSPQSTPSGFAMLAGSHDSHYRAIPMILESKQKQDLGLAS